MSSSELQEAINSMFRWYEAAQVCYAYLSDVSPGDENPSETNSSFQKSKWFTRGWTLQELLAPDVIIFFDRHWVEIGTKHGLRETISSRTGIEHLFDFKKASIAQKMSWASTRETLRPEDIAYCLMGLFGVNMPLLYGEGSKAFIRLQIEIMRSSDDDSIFAWRDHGFPDYRSGLLARSPFAFMGSGGIKIGLDRCPVPYSMTNKGLQITLRIPPLNRVAPRQQHTNTEHYNIHHLALLYCFQGETGYAVVLQLARHFNHFDVYSRVYCDKLLTRKNFKGGDWGTPRTIFIPQKDLDTTRTSKPTMISIRGRRYGENEPELSLSKSILYGGQFDTDHFIDQRGGHEIYGKVAEAPDGVSSVVLKLRTGILILDCRVGKTLVGLRIDNPQQRSPTIGILVFPPRDYLGISEYLREPVLRLTEDKANSVLSTGELVTAILTRGAETNQHFFIVQITIRESEPKVQDSSTNRE